MVSISHPPSVVASMLANLLVIGAAGIVIPHCALAANDEVKHGSPPLRIKPATKPQLDFSGQERVGVASFYAEWFAGRKMASGARMNPTGNNAASRVLPLGTIARVTNLDTHKSAVVTIQDRGPYVQGRIVDLSPSTAREIGITRKIGIARVRVTPIAIPLRIGRIKLATRPIPNQLCDHRCAGYKVALEQRTTPLE